MQRKESSSSSVEKDMLVTGWDWVSFIRVSSSLKFTTRISPFEVPRPMMSTKGDSAMKVTQPSNFMFEKLWTFDFDLMFQSSNSWPEAITILFI